MDWGRTREARRRGVVANYVSAALLAAVFCAGEYGTWNLSLAVVFAAGLGAFTVTFFVTYGRSGFWSLARAEAGDLDERQILVTHESFRRSYAVFAIVSLLLVVIVVFTIRFSLVGLTWRGHYSFGLAIMFLLGYLAQVLPASLLAWRETVDPASADDDS
ncbi:MAG: hypothetical protein GY838_01510 [bacterium]|nr:hypothetical protein [bacterium]